MKCAVFSVTSSCHHVFIISYEKHTHCLSFILQSLHVISNYLLLFLAGLFAGGFVGVIVAPKNENGTALFIW